MSYAYRQTHDLPGGYSVEFALSGGRLDCIWSPEMPTGKRAKKLRAHYRRARDSFIASLGIPTLVIEL